MAISFDVIRRRAPLIALALAGLTAEPALAQAGVGGIGGGGIGDMGGRINSALEFLEHRRQLNTLAVDTAILDKQGGVIGTVSQIVRSEGRVRQVFVTTTDGRSFRLRLGSLSLRNTGWVTTDGRFNN